MPHGDRFPDTSYKGIDSFTFKAPSDFIDKHSNWKKINRDGSGMSKGPSMGIGGRVDFTDPYKHLPSPF